MNFILAERVYKFVARAARVSREDPKRIRFGHKSFYRFSIRSSLATNHKQIIKTPNARHRAFWVSRQHGQRLFIHPLFITYNTT